jgi:hypothetical protein
MVSIEAGVQKESNIYHEDTNSAVEIQDSKVSYIYKWCIA